MQATLLARRFELGGELRSAVDLHRPDGKRHAVLQGVSLAVKAVARVWAWITSQRETTSRAVNCLKTTPGTGRTSRVSTSTRSPGSNTAYCLGFRTA